MNGRCFLGAPCLSAAAVGLVAAAVSLLAVAQQGSDPTLQQEQASLKAVCSHCHNLEIVTNAVMGYPAWHDTVQSMIDRGAVATDEQLDDIMDYLHRTATTINVNTADAEELGLVLEVPDPVVNDLVARRKAHPFSNLADLKAVPGIKPSVIDAKARLLFFK